MKEDKSTHLICIVIWVIVVRCSHHNLQVPISIDVSHGRCCQNVRVQAHIALLALVRGLKEGLIPPAKVTAKLAVGVRRRPPLIRILMVVIVHCIPAHECKGCDLVSDKYDT